MQYLLLNFNILVKAIVNLATIILVFVLIMQLNSCSNERPRVSTVIEVDDGDNVEDDEEDIDICARSEGSYRSECQEPTFFYEIIQNYKINDSSRSQRRLDNEQYIIFWARPGGVYKWKARFVPEESYFSSRQIRFIVNEDELPDVIEYKKSSSSSKEVSFEVNLDDTLEDEDGVEITAQQWLEDSSEKIGEIEVEVQDVSYCFLQNRINRDVSASQVDCNNPDIDGSNYRSNTIFIPYNLDFDGERSQLFCSVSETASSLASDVIPRLLITVVGELANHVYNGGACYGKKSSSPIRR